MVKVKKLGIEKSKEEIYGKEVIDSFNYHPSPPWDQWNHELEESADLYQQTQYIVDKLSTRQFSCIIAMGGYLNLGIINSSHRGPSTDDHKIHTGSHCYVQVPDQFMNIFNANLFHHCAKSKFR